MQPDTTLKSFDDRALWVSISELARRKGLAPQSVHERIKRLGGKIEIRPGKGRERLVNIAQFDQLTGDNSFLPQASAAATVRMLADEPLAPALPAAPGGKTISEVQRDRPRPCGRRRAADGRSAPAGLAFDGQARSRWSRRSRYFWLSFASEISRQVFPRTICVQEGPAIG
jgi:hypothetical protein